MTIRYTLPVIVLLSLVTGLSDGHAQTVVLYNVDASAYPTITANIVVVDGSGRRIPSLSPDDFLVLEDGLPVGDLAVSCPEPEPERPFAAVLVNDRSGSMSAPAGGGRSRMDLVKIGSTTFVNLVDYSRGSEVALTAFDEIPAIISDFRQSAPPLLAAIASLTEGGGTLYDPPFLDAFSGALAMLSTRAAYLRRVVVFLTDGQPNATPSTNAIAAAANAIGARVYAVTVGMPMNPDLRVIASRTGGMSFENVRREADIRAVYEEIAFNARGVLPCRIAWLSHPRCGTNDLTRRVGITYRPNGAYTEVRYDAPPQSLIGIQASPEFLYFGATEPPDSSDRQLTITARNSPITIDAATVTPGGAFRVVDWDGSPPPFTLADGASRVLVIRFRPPDATKYVASLMLSGSPCPPFPVTLTGGVGRDDGPSLKLLAPLGGELFAGCDSVEIRWGGVAPDQPVDIEFSPDDGATWVPVATGATQLAYRWLPPGSGTAYRIRISSRSASRNQIGTVAGGGMADADSILATQALLWAPSGVATSTDTLYVAESGAHRIRRVDPTTGIVTTIAGTGNPGFSSPPFAVDARLNAPNDVLVVGNYLFIAEAGNHRVRAVNLSDGRISTIAGTGASAFGGDSLPALDARLSFPSYLAASGSLLFVTDAGNMRIRAIDLSSGIIATVAGGGTNAADDIPATSAALAAPAGISVAGGYLYIAESGGARIRRVSLASGLITTVAGTGYPGTGGDGGQARNAMLLAPVGVEAAVGRLFIADSAAHQVRLVDLATGIITTLAGTTAPGYSGDGGDASLARLNRPGQPTYANGTLYVPDIGNNRIRAITVGHGPVSDSSRSPFGVSGSRLAVGLPSRTFAIGGVAVGRSRDTTIAAAICNRGDGTLIVDSARVTGADAADFEVVGGVPSLEIAPGACEPIEIRFHPSALGTRRARIVLHGQCANEDTLFVEGVGVTPCDYETLSLVDAGTIVIGAGRDTLVERSICNTGTGTITGSVRLAEGSPSFSIVSGGGPFTLEAGACRDVRIRYEPRDIGRTSGLIDYGLPAACGRAVTRLYGVALEPASLAGPDTISFPATLCPGEARDTTLIARNPGGVALEITSIAVVEDDEGFAVLFPNPSASSPVIVAAGDSLRVALRLAPARPGPKRGVVEIATSAGPRRIVLTGFVQTVAVAAASPVVFGPDAGAALPRDTIVMVENRGTVNATITGMSIEGADAASFAVPPGQTPVDIPIGERRTVRIQLVAAPATRPVRAQLALQVNPACDTALVRIDLIGSGTSPALSAEPPVFRDLRCPDETFRDTSVLVRNIGGAVLTITRAQLRNDAGVSFLFSPALPVDVPPAGAFALPIRFAPTSAGTWTAELVLESNDPASPLILPLRGVRQQLAVASDSTSVDLGRTAVGIAATGRFGLRNVGSMPISLRLKANGPEVTVVSGNGAVVAPGNESQLTLRFLASLAGRYDDTLVVCDASCGVLMRIPVTGIAENPALVVMRLPWKIAQPGEPVSLPITREWRDSAAFTASGARRCTVSVQFLGTVLRPDGITSGNLLSSTYDSWTRIQRMVFACDIDETDSVLTSIVGRAVGGDTIGTALEFTRVEWDSADVGTETVNGSLAVVGGCFPGGMKLIGAPAILKVRPSPASTSLTVDIVLQDWSTLSVTLYDARGWRAYARSGILAPAGTSTIVIPTTGIATGEYLLTITSPFGEDRALVQVAR